MTVLKLFWDKIQSFLQIQLSTVSYTEQLVSVTGGFVGIFLVILISNAFVDPEGATLIIASMGASAVLLFVVPHGALSQPWPLIGGHLISALIGVICAKFIPNQMIAAAAAVSIAIGAMQLFRCIHPPGGATALFAVLGGEAIQSLGFQFILTPVLINVLTILVVAVVFNLPFSWRRYPSGWARLPTAHGDPADLYSDISHADFVVALSEMDSFIDITEQDLLRIYDLVTRSEQQRDSSS